jgi:IS30 family transposase
MSWWTLKMTASYALHAALQARMNDLPPGLLRSITWDQGTEMARHTEIAASLRTKIYSCDSRSPWQRPSNENTNGLLRQYFPKGTDLSAHPPEHLNAVENELNRRPGESFRTEHRSTYSPRC